MVGMAKKSEKYRGGKVSAEERVVLVHEDFWEMKSSVMPILARQLTTEKNCKRAYLRKLVKSKEPNLLPFKVRDQYCNMSNSLRIIHSTIRSQTLKEKKKKNPNVFKIKRKGYTSTLRKVC